MTPGLNGPGIGPTERINAPARPEEGPAYGLARAQIGLEELFVGGRRRRVWGIALLLSGLAFGAIGNLLLWPPSSI